MHIGVAVLSTALPEQDQQEYLQALLESLPAVAPQHTFIFIADGNMPAIPSFLKMLPAPLATGYFGLRHWYGKMLPALLKKEEIDALIIINGILSNASILQVPVFISPSSTLLACKTWLRFLYKRYLAKCLQKVSAVAVIVTKQQKSEMQKLYGIKESQLFETGYAVPTIYQPIEDWQQRETFLQQQNGGREYFLCLNISTDNDILSVLKAFSLFKKRQQSNMQLIIAGRFFIGGDLKEKIATYKYRQDIVLLNEFDNSVLPQLLACAYAVLFTPKTIPTAQLVAAAMQCHVPVISLETNEAVREIAGEAALYADASVESLAEQMKLIYKDEALRQNLIFHSRQQAVQLSGREVARKILSQMETV